MTADDDVDDSETRVWLWADLAPGADARYRFAVIGPYPSWQDATNAADHAPKVLDLDGKIRSAWRVDETEPTTDCELHRIDEGDDTGDWFG